MYQDEANVDIRTGKKKERRLYTTEIIKSIKNDISEGFVVDSSPFYSFDIDFRAANVTFKMTQEEMSEYEKCFSDASYFIENYCKFLTDNGRKNVVLRDYQHEIIDAITAQHYDPSIDEMVPDNRNIILLAARQIGKTTTTAAYITWYICFHNDRNVGIMANKEDTAKEIVDKVREMVKGLPYFLQPGVKSFGMKGASFDNGCKIISSATTKSASIGFTMNGILYLDEFAHIEKSICGSFWRSVYPTLSSSKTAQLIVSSTPNGTDNTFADLWFGSQDNSNSFKGIRVDYWRVPGHDDEWAEEQKRDFGEEFFNQEFLLQFSSSSSSLLKTKDFQLMERICKPFETKNIVKDGMHLDDPAIQWHPDFDPNGTKESDFFVFCIDVADGSDDEEALRKEGKKTPDYNTLIIFKVVPNSISNMLRFKNGPLTIRDAFRFVEVGRFMRNDQDETYLANVTSEIAFDLFNALENDNVRIMIEMNFQGNSFIKGLMNHPKYYDDIIVKTYHRMAVEGEKRPPKKKGFLTNSNKNAYCIKGKDMIGKRRIVITDKETFSQLKTFGWVRKKLKGISAHDDLSYPSLNHIPRFMDEDECVRWLEDWLFVFVERATREKMNYVLKMYAPEDEGLTDEEFNASFGMNDYMPGVGGNMFDRINQASPYSSNSMESFNPYRENTDGFPW